jgi:hypothetical protein
VTFTPHGDWLHSDDGCYRISRMELHVGRVYTAYAIDPPGDWGPVMLDNFTNSQLAMRACEMNSKFGGAPL